MRPRKGLASVGTLVLVALIGTAAVGCGGESSGGRSAGSPATGRGGELVWAKPSEVQGLDPTTTADGSSWEILDTVYETLVGVDEDLKPTPELAESWTQPSPTSYVFTIRKGVKFSNGRQMKVDDVIGSLKRLIDPDTGSFWAVQLGHVRSVTRAGPWKVKVTLEQPRPSFLPALASVMAAILPIEELRSGDFDPKKELLGTGPFTVADHRQNESWTLARNPHYWRADEPKLDTVLVRIMPEDASRVAALRDGSVDVTTFDTPDVTRLLEGQANIESVVQETTDYYKLNVNAITSSLRDDRLREAVSLSIDRNRIRDLALAGVGEATAAVAPAFEGSCGPATVPFAEPDLERAKALVAAAGARGRKLSIIATPAYKAFPQIAQVIQENLEAVGLETQVLQLDLGEMIKRVSQDEDAPFDMAVSWFAGYADPAMVLAWWDPQLAVSSKYWLKPDEQLIGLVQESLRMSADADRGRVMQQACERIAETGNIIPLVSRPAIVVYRSDKIVAPIRGVEGYAFPLRDLPRFALR